VGGRHAPITVPPGKRPITHGIGGWVGPRTGLDGCAISRLPTRFRSLDRPVCSELLYRLRFPGPHNILVQNVFASSAMELLLRNVLLDLADVLRTSETSVAIYRSSCSIMLRDLNLYQYRFLNLLSPP
jgi:hypothetical protein